MTRSRPIGRLAPLFVALPVALVAVLSSVVSISAAGPIKLSLTPIGATGSNFVVTMQPGENRGLAVKVGNAGAEPIVARTFAADAYSMVNGGFAVRLEGEPSGGTTSWLSYPSGDLELDPGSAVERDFTVAVPATTPPGEYLTSIVLQNAVATSDDAPAQSRVAFKQIVRQVVAVSIDVPGARRPALELGPVTHTIVAGHSSVAVGVHNVGNVRLKPTGEFQLWDSTGREVTSFAVTMDTVYAHTDTTAEIPFSALLNPGDYTAAISVTDPSGLSIASGKLPLTIAEPSAPVTALSTAASSALAQTNQTPTVPAVPMNPWMLVLIAFGAGLTLTSMAVGVGFAIHRRRRKA